MSRAFLCTRPTLMSVNAPDTKSPNLCVARFTECDYALDNYIYLGIHICVFPHMFIPRHICGAHCAVAVCTSVPCMLEDLYLDLHVPTCQCVYLTFWLSIYIACPSCLCVNVMVDGRGYHVGGPHAFPARGDHVLFQVLGSTCFSTCTHLFPWHTASAGVKVCISPDVHTCSWYTSL